VQPTDRPACYSALHLLDRWALQLRTLAGDTLPEPPPVRGRVIRAPPVTDADEFAAAFDALEQRTTKPNPEVTP